MSSPGVDLMTLIKICGITNLEDALFAVESGADALGFNFYPPSPRYLTPEVADEITRQLPGSVQKIGVFVNETTSESLVTLARRAGMTAVQLHGDESPEFCSECTEFSVIKAFAVGPQFDSQLIGAYRVDGIMLDASHRTLRGGTGCRVDWDIARRVRGITDNLFLAGGLSPKNVAEALEKVQPNAVDVCSGVESSPGRKHHELVRTFIAAVRSFDKRTSY
jgi:phosphoribosylanthranilate isomerase